jgi:hypothetical protein
VGASSLWPFALSYILVNYIANPKGGGYNVAIWDCPKLEYFFCDGQINGKIKRIEL